MRKLGRVAGVIGISIAVVVLISAASNLVSGAIETANDEPYGEAVSIGVGEVNVSMTGDGERILVLLSGYGTASPVLDFAPLVDELDDTYTVVVVERLGYGHSDLDVIERTVEDVSTELHEVLAKFDAEDYLLVAHSLAGIYSLDYVNRYPGEIAAVVTIDGTVPEDFALRPRSGSGIGSSR